MEVFLVANWINESAKAFNGLTCWDKWLVGESIVAVVRVPST
jgi:hypothetical protein